MARLEPFSPKAHGKPRVDDRRVLSGIVFINRSGLRWMDTPKDYGPHKTLYNRWKRWSEKGVFARMMAGLAVEQGEEKPEVDIVWDDEIGKSGQTHYASAKAQMRDEPAVHLKNLNDGTYPKPDFVSH
jgi:transposase